MPPRRTSSLRRALVLLAAAGGAVVGVAVSAVAQPTGEAPWPMFGRDAAHVGVAEGPQPPYAVAWSSDVPEAPVAGPVAAGEAAIVVGAASVAALDIETGNPLWERERVEGPAGAAAVAGDVVVHATGSGSAAQLVARSVDSGIERWRAFIGASVPGAPVVAGERVYVTTRAGSVFALDAADGEIAWEVEVGGRSDAAPAASGELVLAVTEDRTTGVATVVALDAASGEERWRFAPDGFSLGSSSVALDEDVAYVGLGDARIRALELASGQERWDAPALAGTGAFRARHVAAISGDVLVPDLRALHAVDAASGEERWTYQLTDILKSSSPAVVGEWAVIGDASGEVAAIDIASGRLVWRADVGDGSIGSPAVDAEHVYLAAQGETGVVVALEHDPEGRLLDVPSPTALFPLTALVNFAAAAAMVGIAAYLLFRFLAREPEPTPASEEGGS